MVRRRNRVGSESGEPSRAGGLDARIRLDRGGFSIDVDLQVAPGETAALLGPNGAGKSTSLAVIAGLHDANGAAEPSNRSDVILAGRVLAGATLQRAVPPDERRIGVVFQDALLFEHLTVLDNVAFPARSRGASRRASRLDAVGWLERLDLVDLAQRRPGELSGGQAQRVAIARALACDPDLLLFDEPLAALDVETRTQVRRALRDRLDAFAGPRLLVTHDPADAFLLADRLHVIEDGRITQVGSPDEIRRRPATTYVAALAGTNLFTGIASGGGVRLDGLDHTLRISDSAISGHVAVALHPRSISLHGNRPEGSQRNVWASTVELVEGMGNVVRVTLAAPIPLAVDVTPGAVADMGIAPGSSVWAAVKATEITTTPA